MPPDPESDSNCLFNRQSPKVVSVRVILTLRLLARNSSVASGTMPAERRCI